MRGGVTTSTLGPERRGLRCLEGKCGNASRYLRAAFTAARPSAFGEALKAAATPFFAAGVCMRASSPSNCPLRASRLRERSPTRASNSSTEIRMARAVSCLVIATAPLRIACSNMVPNSFLNRVAGTDRISTSSPSIRKYADRKIDFADATLVWLANHTGMRDILTVDEADFSVYRLKGGKRFVLMKWFE